MSGATPRGKKATPGWPFSLALNHLLAAEPWARARLAPFAGATLELRNPPWPAIRLAILPDGTVEPGEAEPALVVTLGPGALLGLARGPDHFLRSVDVAGDPALAAAAMELARHLRWDVEEDLSRVFGDVVAHRVAEAGRAFAAWNVDVARRLTLAAADYAVDESRLLAPRTEVEEFAARVTRLRDAVDRLEKRIERLA